MFSRKPIYYLGSFLLLAVFSFKIAGFHGFTHLFKEAAGTETCKFCADFCIQQQTPFVPDEPLTVLLSPPQAYREEVSGFYEPFCTPQTPTRFFNKPPPFWV